MAGPTDDSLQQLTDRWDEYTIDLSTPIYATLDYDSASLLSKSSTWLKLETFLSVCCDVISPGTEANSANLVENLLSTSTDKGHNGTCKALKTYLEHVLPHDNVEIANRFVSESPRQLLSSKTTRPDISCCIKHMEGLFTILQFEVLSSGDSTTKKLAMQLMMQLIGIRHKDSTQQRVAGFYVPTVDRGGILEKVVCKWSDVTYEFIASTEFVENAESSISIVYREQCKISFPAARTDAAVVQHTSIPLTKT